MRASLLLVLAAVALTVAAPVAPAAAGPGPAAAPTARAGDVFVAVSFEAETDAAWAALAKLGYRNVDEQRVMVPLPGGKRGCVAVFRGWLPGAAIGAARKVAGVKGVHPVPPEQR